METKNINGEELTMEEAFKKNDRLIWSIAKRYFKKGETLGLQRGDLHSLCSIGFVNAFNRFDPITYPVKFSTYAVPMMMGELQRYFRDHTGDVKFSRRIYELANKIYKEGMEEETEETICLHFDVSKREVKDVFEYMRVGKAMSTEHVIYKTDGEEITLGDQLGDNKLSDYTMANVNEFLDSLEPRDRLIIELTMQEKTQQEIADKIGVSQVQVSRIMRRIHPLVEEFFGYPVGHFSNRKEVTKKEMAGMAKKERKTAMVKTDIELAKTLIKTTNRKISDISKETGCSVPSLHYWVKKLRDPQVEENPVTISKIEPIKVEKEFKDVQSFSKALEKEVIEAAGVSAELFGEERESAFQVELGVPVDDGINYVPVKMTDEEAFDYESNHPYFMNNDNRLCLNNQAQEDEMREIEKAAKFAEEHRQTLLRNCKREFFTSLTSNDVPTSDLHTLFTQVGHSATSSGIEKLNVSVTVSTRELA